MSNPNSQLPFPLGSFHDYTAGQDMILGRLYTITDGGPHCPGTARTPTNRQKRVMLVLNSSGVSLLPGMAVVFKTGAEQMEVDGYARTTYGRFAGVVDEWVPSTGVPTGKCFFITVEGPTLFRTSVDPGSGLFYATGDVLGAVTAAASTHSTTGGRFLKSNFTAPTAVASAGTFAEELRGARIVALSACTTAETNTLKLGHLKFIQ